MPANTVDQPLNRGLTLIELTVGIAILGTMVLVVASLFKAGIVTYNFTMQHLIVLTHSRQALDSPDGQHGLLWTIRKASAVSALESSELTLKPPAGDSQTPLRFYLSQGSLFISQLDVPHRQAGGIDSLQFGYYGTDPSGRLVPASSAEAVTFVTQTLSLPSYRQPYISFSGAALRNRPNPWPGF